jgi:hypothetical protein
MTSVQSEQQVISDLIKEIEDALEALAYYDDVRVARRNMDEHTNNVIIMCGRALHRATAYLGSLRDR